MNIVEVQDKGYLPALKHHLPLLLVWSCIALLPFGRSVELPVAIMAIWSLRLIWVQGRGYWWSGGARLFTTVFLLVWLSAIVSSFDAVNAEKTVKTVLTLPRLYLAGLFAIFVLADAVARARFLQWSAWLLLVWIGDALLQALVGVDLLGYERVPQRLNGLFGDEIKLGIVLAVFLPLLFEHAIRNWGRVWQIVVLALAALVIFLAGSRGGWIMFALVVMLYMLRVAKESGRSLLLVSVGVVAAMVMLFATMYHTVSDFQRRVDKTMLVFSGEEAAVDKALSMRLPIWRSAVDMFEAHPVNGVGARGFRYAYPEFAGADDPFYDPATGAVPTHSHQLILEILTETGIIGLACLALALVVLARAWRNADRVARQSMFVGGVAVVAAFFPVNTHFAFYSSFWSQILWFVVAVYCAGLAVRGADQGR